MPRIFDNIERDLLPALQEAIQLAHRTDFCVAHFNLRGWKRLGEYVEDWFDGEGNNCCLLTAMQKITPVRAPSCDELD